ncbi:hypothetical protein BT63DRAFT_457178 [Microthyrium microscopicum]|uniref:Uncharacterized protein n=1 Tax=Microthyrium microscopicum TaxID=703497 RepID=A0A6A6U8V5_9PEZI|nr:hypothetical protein BT63DRAFT_457178 [Microthyrium microscopicum]
MPLSGDSRVSPHGALEVLNVINELEAAGITCCLVGVSALRYYGAARARDDWEICVPTESASQAANLIKEMGPWESLPPVSPAPCSLAHTYPRFGWPKSNISICIMPSKDAHLECFLSNLEHSHQGLPYPKVEVFAQSLLDVASEASLADLIDGMDLEESWGDTNLDLDGTIDLGWTNRQTQNLMASIKPNENNVLLGYPDMPQKRRDIWQASVRSKVNRFGPELPEDLYNTRFRPKCSPDPRDDTERLDMEVANYGLFI